MGLEVGDIIFEGFKVIKVGEDFGSMLSTLISYEIVDLKSKVVYLFVYFSYGGSPTCTMTPLYNPDGTLRMYRGK